MQFANVLQISILSLCAIVVTGCSSENNNSPPASVLNWNTCIADALFQCATVDVPLDYQQRDAETIQLALKRKAAPVATRKGVLLVHLGGQGEAATGVNELVNDSSFPDVLLEEFDVVGFDPRGAGNSTPTIECEEFRSNDINSYPSTTEELQNLAINRTQFARDCFDKYGKYLQLVGSLIAAHDMEEIRLALGEEKINFLGVSYGTRMGALYLQTYPANSGSFVLDSGTSPDPSLRSAAVSQLLQFQVNLETFFSGCAVVDPDCNPAELITMAESRIESLAAENAGREFELFFGLLSFSAESPDLAPLTLSPLVNYLQNRDLAILEEPLGELFDEFNDFEAYTAVELAVLCADYATRPEANSTINDLAEFDQISTIFAEFFIGDLTANCIGWPEALNPPTPISTSTAPQAVVIGGTTDPITPLQGSRDLAAAIGGYFIESAHPGHSTLYRDNECVDSAITDFLRTGNLPTISECPAPGDQ